jgi:hypothetical protein
MSEPLSSNQDLSDIPYALKYEALVRDFIRYRDCLYRANGRLIQLGQEPEKLDYSAVPADETEKRDG